MLPNGFTLPKGYEHLRGDCANFFADHPHYHRNVFIMCRFDDGDALLRDLDEALRKALCRHRLNGLRADDKMYPSDSQLWRNVCIYMVCCQYGVAVLEDRAKDEFNPNVALEYGFMRALDKRVLLLTDRGFRNLRADILGTVREPFDITNLAGTLEAPIERWIHSLDVDLKAGASPLQQQALTAYRRLLNIKCANLMRDKARRKKEKDDEIWYFGEEIAAYEALLRTRHNAYHAQAVAEAKTCVVLDHDKPAAVDELIERFAQLAVS
jgi:hypothetical protein